MENPFEDLLDISSLIKTLEEKGVLIDSHVGLLNERKFKLQAQINFLISQNNETDFFLIDKYNFLTQKLNDLVEKRVGLMDPWEGIVDQRNALLEKGEMIEKEIFEKNTSELSPRQITTIELMVVQLKQVLKRQEQLLNIREEILKEEEQIVTESEQLFVNSAHKNPLP
jgi:hypothetical protein